jgi:hypothetical protein
VITTETFKSLITAQAKARKLEPHMIVVKHPVGGLNAVELQERIEVAFTGLSSEMKSH